MLQQLQVDRLFAALGDASRRDMVEALSERPRSVTDLAERYRMSLSAVGQHLRVLERSGLVLSEKRGRVRTCRLSPDGLATLDAWIAARRATLVRRLDRLEAHLAKGTRS